MAPANAYTLCKTQNYSVKDFVFVEKFENRCSRIWNLNSILAEYLEKYMHLHLIQFRMFCCTTFWSQMMFLHIFCLKKKCLLLLFVVTHDCCLIFNVLHNLLKVSFCDGPLSVVHRPCVRPYVHPATITLNNISETTHWILTKLHRNNPWVVPYQSCSNRSSWLHK